MHDLTIGMVAALFLGLTVSAAPADQLVVGLMGDSTVSEYKPDSNTRGWGQYLGEFLPSAKIINKAEGGMSTKTCLLKDIPGPLLAQTPNYVLIQCGHNDSHAPNQSDAITLYKENLRKMIDLCRAAGAIPVLITPVHRRVFEKDGKLSQELLPYAQAMKEVAREKKVFLVDLHTSSGKLLEKLGDAGSADLSCSADDRSHFSPKGARIMARLVAEGLQGEKGQLAQQVKIGK